MGAMTKGRMAKYKIGDYVMGRNEEIFGKIVNVHLVEGQWFYRLHNREELYREDQLSPADEDAELAQKENVHIDYRFQFGDIVHVKGYGSDLFVVIGFRAEIWRYKNSAWEDLIYELSRLKDGEWLEATEEELVYIADEQKAKKFLLHPQLRNNPTQKPERKKDMADIDMLLDMYNDYKRLYELFGENTYRKKMKEVLKKLEAIVRHFQK